MLSTLVSTFSLALLASARATPLDGPGEELGFRLGPREMAPNMTEVCSLDQTRAPGNLSLCGNSTLFNVFRPKARFIAPEGWLNDPMGMYQREDGSYHVGYQAHPQHIQWGNISMAAAVSNDFATWTDLGTPEDPRTIYPSTIYDIRGVFDGTIIPARLGWEGNPTIFYTSTFTGPLGAVEPEEEGTETQSMAYTENGGESWIKLNFGAGGNPIIYNWPLENLTGFRDPFVFESPKLALILANSTTSAVANTTTTNSTSSNLFATISGGVRGVGSKLLLYRQATVGDLLDWTYVGPIFETALNQSWSIWSGNYGINFETASVMRLNNAGDSLDDGTSTTAVDFLSFGTERGRDTHELHWPLWAAVEYGVTPNGSVTSNILYSGVVDWGRAYAYLSFPINNSRMISVGWTYEDENGTLALAKQQGYQGAFTSFRENYLKSTPNVNPATNVGLYERASWGVKNETNGSVTITTLGQRIVPEVLNAYFKGSKVSYPADSMVLAGNYTPFVVQPAGRFYVVKGSFEFQLNSTAKVGFRVLASAQEYTDVLYDPVAQDLTVVRAQSSLIKTYGNSTELAKLKLWNTFGSTTRTLKLMLVVDNSVLEVHANDEAVITTRVYPWLTNSTGTGLLSVAGTGSAVRVSGLQLWDGLVNAWPARAPGPPRPLVWDGPIAAIYGLWAGF